MRQRSITGPLILVIIGILFLLNNLGHDVSFWAYIGDYWPFLLIGIGVVGLVEVLFHAGRGSAPPPRPFGGGAIFWIIILCLFVSTRARNGMAGFPFYMGHWAGGASILGQDYGYDVNLDAPPAGVTRLIIDNIEGNISVHGDDSGQLKVSGHKNIRAFNKNDADRANREGTVHLDREGDTLILRSTSPAHNNMLSVTADLEITVPASMNVESRGRGDLTVSDLTGTVNVAGSGGDVRLNNLAKDVHIDASGGGLIRATGVKGNFELQGRGNDVQLENIEGLSTISGQYSGTLEFRRLGKALRYQSTHSDLRVEQVTGSIELSRGDIKINGVVGPVRFKTGSRDVTVEDFSDTLDLDVDTGDIQVNGARSPLAKMDLRTRHGNIVLSLPDKAGFDLDGRTSNGEVQDDYGAPLSVHMDGRGGTIKGKTGNGPQISMVADRGTLTVNKKTN